MRVVDTGEVCINYIYYTGKKSSLLLGCCDDIRLCAQATSYKTSRLN